MRIEPNSSLSLLVQLPGACHAWSFIRIIQAYDGVNLFTEAIEEFRAAIAIAPDFPGALLSLSASLEKNGQYEESLIANEKVLDIKPHDAPTLINHGNLLIKLERPKEAIVVLRKAAYEVNANKHDKANALKLLKSITN